MKYILTLTLLLGGIVLHAQTSNSPSAYTNIVRIKLTPEDEASVRAGKMSRSADGVVAVGIKRLDNLNRKYGMVEMKRVFRPAGKYEGKHRKYGLHLWYDLVARNDINVAEAVTSYQNDASVQYAEAVLKPVRILPAKEERREGADQAEAQIFSSIGRFAVPNDPDLSKQWYYYNNGLTVPGSIADVDINMYEAWDITTGSSNVTVCIVDGGVDYTHEDLSANMWTNPGEIPGDGIDNDGNGYIDDIYGYNFFDITGTIYADDHGTHVAGVVSADRNNGKGIAGIAGGTGSGDGARIMTCQIFKANDDYGVTAADAIVYGADNGAVISQNSWGYNNPNDYEESVLNAIRYFIAEAGTDEHGNPRPGTPMVGGIVIFAAGNDGSNGTYYPGAFPEVLSVSAVRPNGVRASYSNYGDWVDIAAPGGHYPSFSNDRIYSTLPGDDYWYMSGTSMACPQVSGVAALILSKYGGSTYTPALLRSKIVGSAKPLNIWDPINASQMGSGLLNAYAALSWTPVAEVSVTPSVLHMFEGQIIQLTASVEPSDADNKNVTWHSSNSLAVKVDASGKVEALKRGTVSVVTATTADGGYTATCNVTVYEDINVPSGFSPNGDGKNDTFEMLLNADKTYGLRVFDKSGQLQYENSSYSNDWDGTANRGARKGEKLPAGTYYYVLTLDGSTLAKRGYVVIRY